MRHDRTPTGRWAAATAGALIALGGCWGSIGDPGSTDEGQCGAVPVPPIKRLSHVEYVNTVRALLPDIDVALPELALDPTPHGFDNDADALRASPLLVDQYSVAANRLAERVRERQGEYLPCDAAEGAACGHAFIDAFAPRAYRRPLTTEERAELVATFDAYLAQDGFDVALELTLQQILQAPQFLYRIETVGPVRTTSRRGCRTSCGARCPTTRCSPRRRTTGSARPRGSRPRSIACSPTRARSTAS